MSCIICNLQNPDWFPMKDGLGLKAFKFISRLRYQTDLRLTRKIKSVRGEQFYRLTGSCRSCGKCCETPMIPVFPLLFFFKSVRWAIVTWHRMIYGFEFLHADQRQKCLVFRCTHWDPVTKHCDSYESRPGMCRDYPRNLLDSPHPVFLEGCGPDRCRTARRQTARPETSIVCKHTKFTATKLITPPGKPTIVYFYTTTPNVSEFL